MFFFFGGGAGVTPLPFSLCSYKHTSWKYAFLFLLRFEAGNCRMNYCNTSRVDIEAIGVSVP